MSNQIVQPNLFAFATSELSQDAFLCWLLAWADARHASVDQEMHSAGKRFLDDLLALHGSVTNAVSCIEIRQQFLNADVLVLINDDLALLIEDKTETTEHSDQLSRYRLAMETAFPDRRILPVLLKTGDQADYSAALAAGYKIVKRRDFLGMLRVSREIADHNAIFRDYLNHLEARQAASETYLCRPVEQWHGWAWTGFYEALQESIPELRFSYVSNAAGGFQAAYWGELFVPGGSLYLQIEEQRLCFKIADKGENTSKGERARMRDEALAGLQKVATGSPLKVRRPGRLGNGYTMTFARADAADWLRTRSGSLDLPATVAMLREAERLLGRCAIVGTG